MAGGRLERGGRLDEPVGQTCGLRRRGCTLLRLLGVAHVSGQSLRDRRQRGGAGACSRPERPRASRRGPSASASPASCCSSRVASACERGPLLGELLLAREPRLRDGARLAGTDGLAGQERRADLVLGEAEAPAGRCEAGRRPAVAAACAVLGAGLGPHGQRQHRAGPRGGRRGSPRSSCSRPAVASSVGHDARRAPCPADATRRSPGPPRTRPDRRRAASVASSSSASRRTAAAVTSSPQAPAPVQRAARRRRRGRGPRPSRRDAAPPAASWRRLRTTPAARSWKRLARRGAARPVGRPASARRRSKRSGPEEPLQHRVPLRGRGAQERLEPALGQHRDLGELRAGHPEQAR